MIYLDNATTSFPKAPGVPEAVAAQLAFAGGSAGRSSHGPARAAAELLFEAREELAGLLGFARPERLIFTKNATEALNLVILGAVPAGGSVATTALEHNAVMRPLRYLEAERAVRLVVVESDESGVPRPEALAAVLASGPDLVVATAASNVTAQLLPIGDIARACGAAGVPLCVDASQFVGHASVDVDALGAAALCFSAHKGLLGPTGIGAVCLAPGFDPEPLLRGGTGSASESESQPSFLPDRYEAGTANLAGAAGLLAAVRYLAAVDIDELRKREAAVVERLLRGLSGLPGLRALGPPPGAVRAALVSVVADSLSSADLALELDRRGIAARAGLHCAPAAHRFAGSLASGGALRLSPGFFTAETEVDEALGAMEEILT